MMKKALGKGLSALIPNTYVNEIKNEETKTQTVTSPKASDIQGMRMIPISDIVANADQPRHDFSPEGIEELAASIQEKGVLQPIIVKQEGENRYVIICGERRFRAAMPPGLFFEKKRRFHGKARN